MAARVELYPSKGGFRYRVVGGNGEKMSPSELYSSKSNARRGIGDLLTALGADKSIEVVEVDE